MKKNILLQAMIIPDGVTAAEISTWFSIPYSRAWNILNALAKKGWLIKEKEKGVGTVYYPTDKATIWAEGELEFNY